MFERAPFYPIARSSDDVRQQPSKEMQLDWMHEQGPPNMFESILCAHRLTEKSSTLRLSITAGLDETRWQDDSIHWLWRLISLRRPSIEIENKNTINSLTFSRTVLVAFFFFVLADVIVVDSSEKEGSFIPLSISSREESTQLDDAAFSVGWFPLWTKRTRSLPTSSPFSVRVLRAELPELGLSPSHFTDAAAVGLSDRGVGRTPSSQFLRVDENDHLRVEEHGLEESQTGSPSLPEVFHRASLTRWRSRSTIDSRFLASCHFAARQDWLLAESAHIAGCNANFILSAPYRFSFEPSCHVLRKESSRSEIPFAVEWTNHFHHQYENAPALPLEPEPRHPVERSGRRQTPALLESEMVQCRSPEQRQSAHDKTANAQKWTQHLRQYHRHGLVQWTILPIGATCSSTPKSCLQREARRWR